MAEITSIVAGSRILGGSAGSLKVMEWNVLGDGTAQDEYEQKHGAVDEDVVGWEARKPALLAEVRRVSPDVLLLCECNRFEEFWVAELGGMGFKGVWGATFDEAAGIWPVPAYFRGAPSIGCAIFYAEKRFREVWSETFRFEQGKTQLAQEALLEPVGADPGGLGRLLVGVTHLKAGDYAEGAAMRSKHARIWAERVEQKLTEAGEPRPELVLAGEVNEPPEATDKFKHVGAAVRLLESSLGLQDAYAGAPPEVTNWAGTDWWCAIDSILHSSGLRPEALLPVPSLQALRDDDPKGFPSKSYPSDHIATAVSFCKA